MKKLILSALSLTFILSAAFFASGCAKKHEHKYTVTVIEPTCSSQGYTEHVCSCGKTYEDNFVEPIDHTQGSPTYTATVNAADATKGVLREITSCKFCSTVLSEKDYNVSLPELTFSYDGKPHESKIAGDKLPDGIDAVYLYSTDVSFDDELPGGIISAGDYAVAATLSKDGAPIDLGFCLISKLRINKDGKYHEVTFCFDDLPTNNVSIAVKDGYTIDEDKMPAIPDKTGYDGEWIYDGDEIYEDTSISVLYTPIEYSIKYVLDGAENNPRNPSYYTYESGTISLYSPESVTGYTFQGWYTSPNFEPQTRVSVISSGSSGNLTLYAKFLKYRVEAADGFTFDYKNYDYPALIQTVSSSRTSIALSTTIQVSKGCMWTLSRDIEGFELIKTKNMSLVEGHNIAYVTVWYDEEYNVVYYLDIYRLGHRSYAYYADGEVYCESATVEEQTYLSAPEAPSKVGYTFNGWYAYNLPDSSEGFNPSSAVIGTTAATFPYRLDYNVVFYAIFTPNVYTATFDVNGGKPLADETQNVTYDSPFVPAAAMRDGYTFVGWKDDEGNVFKSLSQWKYDYPVTFTAQWSLNTYEIIYNLNGGTNNKNNPATYTIESDTVTLETPEKTAYFFAGWFTDRDFTDEITEIAAGSFGNKTVYAKWTPVVYDIIYELDGGANDENNPTTYTVETPTIEFFAPSKTGYTFNGWYAEKDFSGDNVTELPQSSYGDVTLYAKWTANKYTITYLDTKLITGTKNTFVYAKGETYVQSVTYDKNYDLINYERTGYAKTGWFNGDEKFDGGIWNLTDDVTLYADWQIVTYNITYVLNGGDTIGENPTEYTIESQDITLADPTGKHTFVGWYKDEALKEKITVITNRSFGDITLYADWQHETATDWVIDKAPTCTNTGLRHKVCSVCGVNYNYETLATVPTAHVRGEEVKENVVDPTCTEDGSYDVVVYCTECNIELSRTTKTTTKLGHKRGTEVKENVVDPTCTQNGSYDVVVYCTKCNKELSRTAKTTTKLGHKRGEEIKENVVDPTCTQNGSYDSVYYCTKCSEELSRTTKTTTKLEHKRGSEVKENVVDPTCTQDGSYDSVYYCTVCGSEASRITNVVNKLGHKYSAEVKENIVDSTCTENGSYDSVYYCTVCNAEISRVKRIIYKLGHKYSAEVKENIVDSTCIEDGSYDSVYYCTVCNAEISRTKKITYAKGHTKGDEVKENIIELTCTQDGSYDSVYYCTVCNAEISRTKKVTYALGHKKGDEIKENLIESSCTENGSYDIVIRCSKCNAVLNSTHVNIEMTDHEWDESKQCKYCHCDYFSQDLKFTLSSSGTSYVVAGIGSCVDLDIIIPANYKGKPVVSIVSEAFSGCDSITSVSIGRNIMSIGRYAFKDCSILKSITWDAENCTDAGLYGDSIFANCLNVTKATISNNVKTIPAFAFQGCKNLTSISIGSGVSSIENSAFRYCSKLSYITVADNNQYFTSISGNLYNKNKTVLIQYAIGKTNSSFAIPNSVTSIADFAFWCCRLTKITIGNSVTSIGGWAFNESTNLINVTFGNSVNSIGMFSFQSCENLSSVIIGNNVSSIGVAIFNSCHKLKTIFYNGTSEQWNKISIESSNDILINADRYYYSESEPALNSDGTAYDGKYWHYDTDGVTPVIWKKEN